MHDGRIVPCHESPERAAMILDAFRAAGLGEVIAADDFGMAPIERVHGAAYVEFLRTAYAAWQAEGRGGSALPFNFVGAGMRRDRVPEDIDGKLGLYAFAADAPIVAGTFEAAVASAHSALTAARRVWAGERGAYALCRPPGHHAGRDSYGGYCYLNNAAIAAQWLRDAGAERVAVLDVDYHHGNGTQDIFYERDDVLTVSIHADPVKEFPYFLGHADERGRGAGKGYNRNFVLPWGTEWPAYRETLLEALREIAAFRPEAVVVSLGVDTFKGDPISRFALDRGHFGGIGAAVGSIGLPTVFVQEGGYAVEDIGANVAAVLQGFAEMA